MNPEENSIYEDYLMGPMGYIPLDLIPVLARPNAF